MLKFNQMISDQVASIQYQSIKQKPMPVSIEKKGDDYLVNGVLTYKDMNGNWVSTQELSTNEHKAFQLHLRAEPNYKPVSL